MLELYEYHWVPMSKIWTPRILHRVLNCSSHASQQCFQRYRHLCYSTIFESIVLTFDSLSCFNPCSLFEWMVREEILPCVQNSHLPNNDAMFLSDSYGGYEWVNVPSVKNIRMYWDSWHIANVRFHKACQRILEWLPSEFTECKHCHWKQPSTQMANDDMCEYCADNV